MMIHLVSPSCSSPMQAVALSGVSVAELSSVEVVGSSMRVPMLLRQVEQVFGKAPSRTLNAKECVSRGAALQCAMMSPTFKVRRRRVSHCGQVW
jgi:heat shock protein 4